MQLHGIAWSHHKTELAMKQLDDYSFGAQYVLDDTQVVLTADRIENMGGCEVDNPITNSS